MTGWPLWRRRAAGAGTAAPLVSVVITAYNYELFVAQAVRSALDQEVPGGEIEVIVVDDGSTDGTPAKLEPYGDRVDVLRQENQGVVSAANGGLSRARGHFIALLNADDVWRPGAVAALAEALREKPSATLAYGDMELIDTQGRTTDASYFGRLGIRPRSGKLLGPLMRQNFISSGALMFRADLLESGFPIPSVAAYEDWYIVVRAAEAGDIEYVPTTVLGYRHHGDNEVLFAEGERRDRHIARVLPFRRWMLANLDLFDVPPADLVGMQASIVREAMEVADKRGCEPLDLLPVTEADRREAASAVAKAHAAAEARSAERALLHAVRALAHDPTHDEATTIFSAAAEELLAEAEAALASAKWGVSQVASEAWSPTSEPR